MRRRRRGQALVEFALVLPVLLLILFGIVDFGRAIYAFNAVSNAAREGGRTAIVNQYPAAVRDKAAQQATAVGLPTGQPANCAATGGPTSDSAGICFVLRSSDLSGVCSSPPDIGCVSIVTVKTTFTALTPIISRIVGNVPIVAQSQQAIESVCNTAGCPR
jgi:Flp pilus assembly protein TadG